MSTPINDGGPAFPEVVTKNDKYDQSAYVASEGGMTLRDYFAGQALAGMSVGLVGELKASGRSEISAYAHGPCNAVLSERSYALADAMLAAREAKK